MNRRLQVAALALGGLMALGSVRALMRIDGGAVREAIGARLESLLGEPVALGEVDLSLFPLPAARIRDARIGTPERPRLEARELRVGISLPALLLGRVVLRSLEVESGHLRLPVAGTAVEAASGAGSTSSRWNAQRAADVQLAITSLRVHGGTLEVGAERLEKLELSGGLDLALGASFDFSAQAAGIARLEDGRLRIEGLTGDPAHWSWTAGAKLAELDLAKLRERAGFRGLWGKAAGTLSAAGTGTRPERAALELASEDLEVRGALLRLWGPTRARAEYPAGTVDVDLSDAQVRVARGLEKPSSVPLRFSARQIEADAGDLRAQIEIESEALEAGGDLHLRRGALELELERGSLDLAAIARAWTGPSWLPNRGRAELGRLRLDGRTLMLRADGSLSGVTVPLGGGVEVAVSGPVFANGTTAGADALRVEIAGETLSTSLRYDWAAQQLQIGLVSEGVRILPILEKTAHLSGVSGRLYARLELAGPPDPYALKGEGEFELVDGEWKGVRLARLAEREPIPDAGPQRDSPQRIHGRLEVDEDEVHMVEAAIEQEDASARLSGWLYLRDLSIDLSGELTLQGPERSGPVVLPILKVGGRLDAPSASIGNAATPEVRAAENGMVEAFRKAERELRLKERGKRKQTGTPGS